MIINNNPGLSAARLSVINDDIISEHNSTLSIRESVLCLKSFHVSVDTYFILEET